MPAGQAARVKATFEMQRVPNLKSALVWGTLPGATDETIYLIAHRDGWFDAAGDNASGVASIIALADYYAKVPQAERRRTMVFVGLDGHHNSGAGAGVGRRWMWDNRKTLFPKTALMINAEHPSTIQTTVRPRTTRDDNAIVWSNTYMPQQWYAGGPSRRKLETIAVNAFREFGASVYLDPESAAAGRRPRRVLPRRAGSRHERVLPLLPHRSGDARTRCRGRASRRRRVPTRRSSTK